MPLSPAEVIAARPHHVEMLADGFMGSVDHILLERFDGGPVELGCRPGGPFAAEIERLVFAEYGARGWDCRVGPDGWVFAPKPKVMS